MSTIATADDVTDQAAEAARWEARLPPLLSVIAGMVDVTSFLTLGTFTAHITGNLVILAAAIAQGGKLSTGQMVVIPGFILASGAAWFIARWSHRRGRALAELLLALQFVLLVAVLVFSVVIGPSKHPHGPMAAIAALIAASAIACQFALFRLALPRAVSTAVMTGNLTHAALSLLDAISAREPLTKVDSRQLKQVLLLLCGFSLGCFASAIAIPVLADWAWLLPVILSAASLALR
jgi:uncharacterized membrane protein YoaK (UPF0700 family)